MKAPVLIVPGIGNSGPDHWQTLWEATDESMFRIQVNHWDRPNCAAWVKAIDDQATTAGESLVVVAHSLGCLAFVHWAAKRHHSIRGALLVAVPDPGGANFPTQAEGFSSIPSGRLPYRTVVVSSRDDPYGSPKYAKACAATWGSTFVDIGGAGHINGASKLGAWAAGLKLLDELRSPSAV